MARAATGRTKTGAGDAPAGARRELLAGEVLDKAAGLFATKGFAATSLQDVADAVGLGRSSLYHYYPNKDALLGALIEGVTRPVARIFSEVEAQALGPRPRLREVIRRLVLWVADPRTHFRLMDQSEAQLPGPVARAHHAAKRRVLREMIGLVEAVVAAGEARALDARVTALSIIGMAMWTAWWFAPRAGQSLADVAEQVADNALAMLARDAGDRPAATIAALAGEIRQSLSLIEQMATPAAASP